MYLLFPGRHLLNTQFQEQYLRSILRMPLQSLSYWNHPPASQEELTELIFAVTSANQEHSRYNPVPFSVRSVGVDRFAADLKYSLGIKYRILGIPHFPPNHQFAEMILKEIEEQTEGSLQLTPENTVVLCSTPAVCKLFDQLGFAILPCELGTEAATPSNVLKMFVEAGENWQQSTAIRQFISPATFSLWSDFEDTPRRILRLWRDPLLTDDGGLTETRDYSSYSYGMSNPAILELKYQDIKTCIVEGKIVDEGCADGALLIPIARDFRDSDCIGIDITSEFIARCKERQRMGEYGDSFVFFHQRNLMDTIFQDHSIQTTICNSTAHELWSYGNREITLHDYLHKKCKQTAKGGRIIIRDVVGPDQKDKMVWLWLNETDGRNHDWEAEFESNKELEEYLNGLSTFARFLRFSKDFLKHRKGTADTYQGIQYQFEKRNQETFAVLSLKDAAEFLSKKDYTDNWRSEMYEEFTFWDFQEWKNALIKAGFQIVENPNQPFNGSRAYPNEWVIQNRFAGKVALYTLVHEHLMPEPWFNTNMVLVGEKTASY